LRSNVDGTLVTVRDRSGNICATERTPATVTLKSGSGYFSRGKYTFTFEKDGYYGDVQKRTAQMDGWYWGNLIFGGILGLLIIDPATGAMFELDENPVNAHLVQIRNWKTAPQRQPAHPVPASAPVPLKQPAAAPAVRVAAPAAATPSAPAASKPPVAAPAQTAAPPQPAAPRQEISDTVQKLKKLRDAGVITQEEFEALLLRSIQKKGASKP